MTEIQVEGIDEFMARLASASDEFKAALAAGLMDLGNSIKPQIIESMQSQFVSDNTDGNLEQSVTFDLHDGFQIQFTATADYAGWWEYGGPLRGGNRPPARPFVREGRSFWPTIKSHLSEFEAMADLVLDQAAAIANE